MLIGRVSDKVIRQKELRRGAGRQPVRCFHCNELGQFKSECLHLFHSVQGRRPTAVADGEANRGATIPGYARSPTDHRPDRRICKGGSLVLEDEEAPGQFDEIAKCGGGEGLVVPGFVQGIAGEWFIDTGTDVSILAESRDAGGNIESR